MMRNRAGWTAIELMVAVGILGIFMTLAAVSQTRLLPHYRLAAATRQVVTDLRLLRAKAISQNDRFKMIFAAGQDAYRAERWNPTLSAWEPYALYRRGAATAVGPQPVSLPSGIATVAAIELTFHPRGTIDVTAGASPIVLSAPGPRTRSVAVAVAGLITIS
jgi:prepilin-type N-terminal cleavage/methylation domain-containing protein